AFEKIVVLASPDRILTMLTHRGRLGQSDLRLHWALNITAIPEADYGFAVSVRAAQQIGRRNAKRRASVAPFFEVQKVVYSSSTHDRSSGGIVGCFVG